MKKVKENKGIVVFYLLLIITTLVVINCNEKTLDTKNDYVYLVR